MSVQKLKDLQLHKNEIGYYLSAVYIKKDAEKEVKTVFPKIPLLITDDPTICIESDSTLIFPVTSVDIGFGKVYIPRTSVEIDGKLVDNVVYYEQVIKKKMTLEEIEKELGYKVEIVEKKPIDMRCTTCMFENVNGGDGPCYSCYAKSNWKPKEDGDD